MWIPKWLRDRKKGVDSAMPTQVVSNEEFIPRPQTKQAKAGRIPDQHHGRGEGQAPGHGTPRLHGQQHGPGHLLPGQQQGLRQLLGRQRRRDARAGAYEDKYPKSEYFIIDVQAHFTNGLAIGFRNQEFVKNMGFKLDDIDEAYAFPNFVKEMFFDSETAMLVISGVPGREMHVDRKGNKAEGPKRGGGVLPSWLMSARKKDINDMAGSVRALCQGNCAPNHYWDMKTNSQDKSGAVRADGTRSQDVRHRLLEVVLPHRPGPLGQRLPARRREADLPVLREIEGAGHEAVQRPQGLFVPVEDARATWPIRRTSRRRPSTIPT